MKIIIRPFESKDTSILMQLFQETVHAICSKHYSPEQISAWAPFHILSESEMKAEIEKWQKRFEENITLVAQGDHTILGFADMTQSGHLDHIYVHKDHQRKGIASLLYKQLEAIAREHDLTNITTYVSANAVPWAKRMGFMLLQEDIVQRKGVALTRYFMKKQLD